MQMRLASVSPGSQSFGEQHSGDESIDSSSLLCSVEPYQDVDDTCGLLA